MKNAADYMAEDQKMIAAGQSGGKNAGRWKSMMTGGMMGGGGGGGEGGGMGSMGMGGGGGGTNPDPASVDAQQGNGASDALDISLLTPDEMLRNSVRGSKPFSKSEIARGYRKL
jgi:hypothetical protein